jgi:hypothetical protein
MALNYSSKAGLSDEYSMQPGVDGDYGELACGICMDICLRPVMLGCGHRLCCMCLAKAAKASYVENFVVFTGVSAVFVYKSHLFHWIFGCFRLENMEICLRPVMLGCGHRLCRMCLAKAAKASYVEIFFFVVCTGVSVVFVYNLDICLTPVMLGCGHRLCRIMAAFVYKTHLLATELFS